MYLWLDCNMDLAKSLFAYKVRDGYAGKEDKVSFRNSVTLFWLRVK